MGSRDHMDLGLKSLMVKYENYDLWALDLISGLVIHT